MTISRRRLPAEPRSRRRPQQVALLQVETASGAGCRTSHRGRRRAGSSPESIDATSSSASPAVLEIVGPTPLVRRSTNRVRSASWCVTARGERPLNHGSRHAGFHHEHRRLREVVSVWDVQLEEPALNRKKRDLTSRCHGHGGR